jgi:nucleoside-diphosphate-sugar epimerase
MQPKRVLVAGAAGFIGSHLVDRYLSEGAVVVGIDNLVTGRRENLESARASKAFTFIEADVSAGWGPPIERIEQDGVVPELILHLASPASPIDYFNIPLATMAANSLGTQNCLEAAGRWNCRFLFASTSEAYGDPLVHPQREDYWGNVNPVGPRACYDESKRFGEAVTMTFVRSEDADARIIRIFNTYGPRMRPNDGRVVSTFIVQALGGEPLTMYGDGAQTRSFCYVDDLVEGIVRCAASDATRGRVVNLGNPEEFTMAELAKLVCNIAGVSLTVEHLPAREDDPGRRRPDIGQARALLGWEPHISCAEGLRRTIDYFRSINLSSSREKVSQPLQNPASA